MQLLGNQNIQLRGNQMEEAVNIYINLQRRIFCELGKRLQAFKQQEDNDAANRIYSFWVDSYETGRQALKRFEAIFENIRAGELDAAQYALGIPPGALPEDSRSCFLYLVLMNEEAPYSQFWQSIQRANRILTNDLIAIARTNNGDQEIREEVDMIATWIATFPHPEETAPGDINEEEHPFFSGLVETGLKIAAGFVLGRYTAGREVELIETD